MKVSLPRRGRFWIVILCTILATLWLRWAALSTGYHTDDSVQIAMLRGDFPVARTFLDLFRFADGARDGRALVDHGYLPWWAEADLKIAMFRPLASALIALDYHLFGTHALWAHVHSFAWWAALLVAAGLLLRQVLPARAAALALVLFAIDESHTAPVAWLANRSSLIATTFGFCGVWLHVRWREAPTLHHKVFEAVAFSLALLGGEYALSVLAYVVALELMAAEQSTRAKISALWPALVPALAYLVLRSILGYGVTGSGYYISAIDNPQTFLQAAFTRVPVLTGELMFGIPAVWWFFGTPWFDNLATSRRWHVAIGVLAMIVFVVAVHVVERLSKRKGSHLRWLCFGSMLSLLPAAGGLPEDRLLAAGSLGACAVFASLIVEGARTALVAIKRNSWARVVPILPPIAAILWVHGVRAWERSRELVETFSFNSVLQRNWALDAAIPDSRARQLRVVIISGADFTTNANLPWLRSVYGHPVVKSYWRLSGARYVHQITRLAPNVIELAVLSSDLDETMAGSLYRSAKNGFHTGDVVRLEGLSVEVLRTAGRTPWLTRLTFQHSLDDPSYLFLHSKRAGLRPFKMPAVGAKLRLPPPEPPRP